MKNIKTSASYCYRHLRENRCYQADAPRQVWTPFTTLTLQREAGFSGVFMAEALFQEALHQRDYSVVDDLLLLAPALAEVWQILVGDLQNPEMREDLLYDLKVIHQMQRAGHVSAGDFWELEGTSHG